MAEVRYTPETGVTFVVEEVDPGDGNWPPWYFISLPEEGFFHGWVNGQILTNKEIFRVTGSPWAWPPEPKPQ